MQAKTIYIAQNGREFDSREECEHYEKTLGAEPGTVGYLRKDMETLAEMGRKCMHGLIVVKHGGQFYSYTLTTQGDIYVTSPQDVTKFLEQFDEGDLYAAFYISAADTTMKPHSITQIPGNSDFWKRN